MKSKGGLIREQLSQLLALQPLGLCFSKPPGPTTRTSTDKAAFSWETSTHHLVLVNITEPLLSPPSPSVILLGHKPSCYKRRENSPLEHLAWMFHTHSQDLLSSPPWNIMELLCLLFSLSIIFPWNPLSTTKKYLPNECIYLW